MSLRYIGYCRIVKISGFGQFYWIKKYMGNCLVSYNNQSAQSHKGNTALAAKMLLQ